MEKIKVFIVLVATSLIFTGCFEQKKNTESSNSESLCKEDSIVSNRGANILNCNYLNGKWNYIYNSSSQDFTISLEVSGFNISGSHCFVYGELGEKMDCPEGNSLSAICSDNHIKGKIHSDWANDSISIELKLVSKDTLSLLPLSDAGMSFFQRKMLFTRKN